MEKQKGIVHWFNEAKGYGYLKQEGKDEPIFVHYSAILCEGYQTLSEGEIVYFEPSQERRGIQALNVTRAKDTEDL